MSLRAELERPTNRQFVQVENNNNTCRRFKQCSAASGLLFCVALISALGHDSYQASATCREWRESFRQDRLELLNAECGDLSEERALFAHEDAWCEFVEESMKYGFIFPDHRLLCVDKYTREAQKRYDALKKRVELKIAQKPFFCERR